MTASAALGRALGHDFRNPSLLSRALSHASAQDKAGDNERLEFLGDRVLGLAVAEMLYDAYPFEDEGRLARRHAALVQKSALARVAASVNLAAHLRAAPGGPAADSVLADAMEAIIGAVHLDAGYPAARKIVAGLWLPLLRENPAPPKDSKTALQEWAQGRGLPVPEYKLVAKTGPEHAPLFEVELRLVGHPPLRAAAGSKRDAEKEAARRLLDLLGATT